jgi:uncharacterized membrane protein YGL010W
MKTIHQWFDEYGVSHQNHTNKIIHWICVPSIFLSVVGLLYSIKLSGDNSFNAAHVALLLVLIFYFRLSTKMAFGIFLFAMLCLFICHFLEQNLPVPLWQTSLLIFVVAWIGQFIGHKIEGHKPSFFKDIQFLLIGPAWLIGFIYRKLGISY